MRHESRKTKVLAALVAIGLSAASGPVAAGVIFSENFEGISTDTILNWGGNSNWTIKSGSVDLVETGDHSITCAGGGGFCIDMEGSTNTAGDMVSRNLGELAAGNYELTYSLSGSQREDLGDGWSDSVIAYVEFGVASWHESLDPNDDWQTFTRHFTLSQPTDPLYLRFAATGDDNVGMLLDNVVLRTVPEPGTLGLLGGALLGMGLIRRRRA